MQTFQQRITEAFDKELKRRALSGEPRLTKTMLWKAASVTSPAATHWFDGSNEADMDTCLLIAPVLRCDPFWLFDGRKPKQSVNLGFGQQESSITTGVGLLSDVQKETTKLMAQLDFGEQVRVFQYAQSLIDQKKQTPKDKAA